MYTPPRWGWAAVGAMLALDVAFLLLIAFFSQRTGWNPLHVLSLAAGGALDYGLHAFTQKPLIGNVLGMRISNTVFLVAAVWLIWLSVRHVIRYQTSTQGAAV
jgi:heme O synthase-like polyprenyltransferase